MIRTIIVEDEQKSIDILSSLLTNNFNFIEVVAAANSVQQGIELINKHDPDLVFLDIVMPGKSGFDLLQSIPEKEFEVIFCTGYDHYAIKAIRFSALDYLVKPIDITELESALERVKNKLKIEEPDKRLTNFISNYNNPDLSNHKLALPTTYGYDYVPVKNIIRLEADGNYTKFFLLDGKTILVSRHLKEYEELLTNDNFLRIHHSHLVNLEHVTKYLNEGYVELSDKTKVEVARRKKSALIEHLKG